MNEISTIAFFKIYQTTSDWRLIDVRDPLEYDEAHIKGSMNIPLSLLVDKHFLFINPNKHYYIICKNGSRSFTASSVLDNLGYNVTNIVGGISRWPGNFKKTTKTRYY
ncbi:MAG: rhodanese-like domain-containing protein [Bacilli bacterium]|nr:rhodanese-like domain-containing protein [Bacilli bacterium]